MTYSIPDISLPGRGQKRKLRAPVIQSPLSGISDQVFRRLVRRWAPEALLFTEMINAKSLDMGYGISKINELAEENGPIGVQIFDYRVDAMVEAAIKAEEAGAFLIDINMGCPVRKIARKGGGSGLIKEPELAAKIVREVSKSVQIPITVKTRLGWCEKTSNSIDFALNLQDAGAQLVTLHGRTRKQGFSGQANWFEIAKVKQALDIPIIANGDINNVEDAFKCLSITKADGVMIGRGSMGAPWLVGQINEALKGRKIPPTPLAKERVLIALEQLNNLLEKKGPHGLLIAKKHMNWTCKGFIGSRELRQALIRSTKPDEAINLLKKTIDQLP